MIIYYDNDLLNGDSEEEVEQEAREDNKEIVEPTREEVEEILRSMKNNKSPGQNGITIENIKYGGEQLRQEIYEIISGRKRRCQRDGK